MLGPGIEVSTNIDTSADTVVLTNRPVLLEGRCAFNRGLVVAGGLEDLVGAAVYVDGADGLGCTTGVIGAEGLDDVVFDLNCVSMSSFMYAKLQKTYKRVLGPAVDAQVAVAARLERARVVDRASSTGVPAFASNIVADIVPADLVRATLGVLIVDLASAVGPEGVEVAVVSASTRAGTRLKLRVALEHLLHLGDVEGEGESAADGKAAKGERLE